MVQGNQIYQTYTLEESKTNLGKHHCLNCKEDCIDPVRNKEVI